MPQSRTTLKTRDGECPVSYFTPERGDGPWPAVLVYLDGRGIRPALFELSERIASAGYFVLLPDLFYRAGPYEAPSSADFARDAELRKRWQAKYMASASKDNVRSDTEAFLAFLAERPEVSSLAIGTTGYCMGGSLSLLAAANFPDRVAAAASYHGGHLVTPDPDSPHLSVGRIRGRVYVAGAVEDPFFTDDQKQTLIEALTSAGVDHVVETYPGAKHGWVPTDSVVYDRAASERHYQTLLDLFESTLRRGPPRG